MKSVKPAVIWITGLSGAGKTTIGREVAKNIFLNEPNTVFLDGDALREIVGDQVGHTREERLKNAFRLSRMCKFLLDQGHNVVCSTMSLFPEIWDWNRKHLSQYFEVYLKVSKDALLQRDTKGIYRRVSSGEEKNVVGWDLPFEEPSHPTLLLENNEITSSSLNERVRDIISAFFEWRGSGHDNASI